MAYEDGCEPCGREFLSESARSQHRALVHGSDAAKEFSGTERKKAASSGAALKDGSFPIKTAADLKNAIAAYGRAKDKAKAKAHIIARAKALGATNLLPQGWGGSDKAELMMHACTPCSRQFAGERSLFQHATALHGYDESADRSALSTKNPAGGVTGAPDYLLGLAPWQEGERRLVILRDENGYRILQDYNTLYTSSNDSASHQANPQGSSHAAPGLSCSSCERSFHTVRGLLDHAQALHDSALDATYNERQNILSQELQEWLNGLQGGLGSVRIYSWIVDMTDTWIVFAVEGEDELFQVTYTLDDSGDATITSAQPQTVRRRTVYEPFVDPDEENDGDGPL